MVAEGNRHGWPVLIAFGSNQNPLPNLLSGLRHLHQKIGLAAVSTVYRSPALPDPDYPDIQDPEFLNGAVQAAGKIDPWFLRQLLRHIEARQQRVRGPRRYAPRSLDLDIALLGEQVVTTPQLVVPDPDMANRPFLVIPLAELAPQLLHPLAKVSLSVMAARFGSGLGGLTVDEQATKLLQAIPQEDRGQSSFCDALHGLKS